MTSAFDISVGQASAIIAVAVFAVQTLITLILPFLLLCFYHDAKYGITASAGAWSCINRLLQSSLWPTVLRSDSVIAPGISASTNIVTYLKPIAITLVTIAAVITPLGLYEDIIQDSKPTPMHFEYLRDSSPFGSGTPARTGLPFNRNCVSNEIVPCPGTRPPLNTTRNSINQEISDYDPFIPDFLVNLFSSGLAHADPTVSSIFDIQWRAPAMKSVLDEKPYLVGGFRQLSSFVLNNDIEVFEGIIVDSRSGGIGFRNHTVPPLTQYGSTWTEDILFLDPVTECVDTNLTLGMDRVDRFDSRMGSSTAVADGVTLIDHGGLSDLDMDYNWWTPDLSQEEFSLERRAYRGAWLNNYLTLDYLRNQSLLNSSTSPAAYSLPKYIDGDWFRLRTDKYLKYAGSPTLPSDIRTYTTMYNTDFYTRTPISWTFNSTLPEFACAGHGGPTLGNISTVHVECGLMLAIAQPVSQNQSSQNGSSVTVPYEQPIYSCATATRASIKTVTFVFNGTGQFIDLKVQKLESKKYATKQERPIWGVETSGRPLLNVAPLWGLIDPSMRDSPNLTSIQRDHLWLPGLSWGVSSISLVDTQQNLPGVSFYRSFAYTIYRQLHETLSTNYIDYTGLQNYGMHMKWQDLSVATPGKIINLIWTDFAANAVVGTRGWVASLSNPGPNRFGKRAEVEIKPTRMVPVTTYSHRIRYKPVFVIPAAILLAFTVLLLDTVACLSLLGKTSLGKLKRALDQTSLGRNLTAVLYPNTAPQSMSRKTWIENNGKKLITLFIDHPKAAESTSPVVDGEASEQYLLSELPTSQKHVPGTSEVRL